MAEHLNLRGDAGDTRFASAVRSVLGFELPVEANTVRQSEDHVAYWLGPDEWLVATRNDGAALAARLRDALGSTFSSVTEIGGGNEVMILAAANARELLAQECPLDLHPDAFGPGRCAQTRFAKAAVLLRPLADGSIELIARRSFADYLRRWLAPAAAANPPTPTKGKP
jgi:sarcosine oxidase, subunit gamma